MKTGIIATSANGRKTVALWHDVMPRVAREDRATTDYFELRPEHAGITLDDARTAYAKDKCAGMRVAIERPAKENRRPSHEIPPFVDRCAGASGDLAYWAGSPAWRPKSERLP